MNTSSNTSIDWVDECLRWHSMGQTHTIIECLAAHQEDDMFVTTCEHLAQITRDTKLMAFAARHLEPSACERILDFGLQQRRPLDLLDPLWERCRVIPSALSHLHNAIIGKNVDVFDTLRDKDPQMIEFHHLNIFLLAMNREQPWAILGIHTPERHQQWEALVHQALSTRPRIEHTRCWNEVLALLERQKLQQILHDQGLRGGRSKM